MCWPLRWRMEGTRVEMEHRGFELYTATGQVLHDAVDADNGWGGLLRALAAAAEVKPEEAARYSSAD